MLNRRSIESKNAPKAIGPYSQALVVGEFVYLSGQLGLDPKTQDFVGEDVISQAKQIFQNIRALLDEAGSGLEQVVKVEIFLTDMNFFPAISDLYGEVFNSATPPVRQTIEVNSLPKWAKVMMSCTAIVKTASIEPGPYFDSNSNSQKMASSFR